MDERLNLKEGGRCIGRAYAETISSFVWFYPMYFTGVAWWADRLRLRVANSSRLGNTCLELFGQDANTSIAENEPSFHTDIERNIICTDQQSPIPLFSDMLILIMIPTIRVSPSTAEGGRAVYQMHDAIVFFAPRIARRSC